MVTIRRLKSLLAATLLVFALLAVAAGARESGRYSCAFKGAKTVASDSLGRTFVLTSGPSYNRTQTYGACLFANGVPRYLVDATGGVVDGQGVREGLTSVDGVLMSGPFEAVYGYIDSGESKQQEPELFVFDARRGYARRSNGRGPLPRRRTRRSRLAQHRCGAPTDEPASARHRQGGARG